VIVAYFLGHHVSFFITPEAAQDKNIYRQHSKKQYIHTVLHTHTLTQ